MPADPSIYDALRYPGHGMPTYQEQQAQRLSRQADEQVLKERQQTLQERQAELRAKQEAAQRQQQEAGVVQDLFARYKKPNGELDDDGLLSEAGQKLSLGTFETLRKSLADARKQRAEDAINSFKLQSERDKYVASHLRGATEATYPLIYAALQQHAPDAAQELGADWATAKDKIDLFANAGMSESEWNDKSAKNAEMARDGKAIAAVVNQLSIAHDQKGLDEALAIMEHYKVDPALVGNPPTTYVQGMEKHWEDMALTPAERQKRDNPTPASEGSDYGRFEADYLAAEAAKMGRTPAQLSPTDRVRIKTAARKAYGQADDAAQRPWAPVVIQTPTGFMQVDRGTGTAAPVTTAGGDQVKRPLPAAAVTTVATGDLSLSMIDDIEKSLPDMLSYIGPYDGRKASASLATGIGATQKLADFDAQLTALKNATIKAITGAQMSEPEAKRIMGQLPDKTQPEAVFKARLAATRRNIETLNAAIQRLSGSGGSAPTGAPRLRFNPATGKVETVK